MLPRFFAPSAVAFILVSVSSACSVRQMATNSVADTLAASGGATFASEEDPDLAGDALPFGLKATEAVLHDVPRHRGLLLAAASGFTRYAYGWVQLEGDLAAAQDLEKATGLHARARRLYLRAVDYGLQGLEVDLPRLREGLRRDPAAALAVAPRRDAPLLCWTGTAWGLAIALAVDDAEMTANQPVAAALVRRALELDDAYEGGVAHDFFIAYEAGRAGIGGSLEAARRHLERAVELSRGQRAFPYVVYAERASVGAQDKSEFQDMLGRALAVDVSRPTDFRLANLLAQKRARWLLSRTDELFVD
jgi:predicted anti-sigma-YlaC factor YlaD